MKKVSFTLIVFSFFFLCDCKKKSDTAEKTRTVAPPTETPTLKRVLIVIDGSNSLNAVACDNILQKVMSIFDALGEMHDLRIFSTIEGTKTPPIFQWKKSFPTRPSEEKKYLTETLPAKKIELEKVIEMACKSSNNGSYILHAIQSAYSNLQGLDPADQTLLIVLSDMLECSPKYYGCSEGKNGFVGMMPTLEKSTLAEECPLINLISLDNTAFCVISMNDQNRYVALSSSPTCKKFWDAAFKKMGYKNGPAHATDIGGFLSRIRS